MGRYSAPLYDDDSQSSAMDWMATADEYNMMDDDVIMADRRDDQSFFDDSSKHQNQVRVGDDAGVLRDPWSLIPCRSFNATNFGSSHDFSSETNEHRQGQDGGADEPHRGGNAVDGDLRRSHENVPSNRIYDQRDAFELAQQFLQHSNFMQQRYFEDRARKRRKTIMAASILSLVLAMVLRRHAPPPPPTVFPAESTIDGDNAARTGSTLVEETISSSSHVHIHGEMENTERIFVRHHYDWRSYCRHVFALIFHIVYYDVLSVACYATLNALFYAAEEMKYWLVQSFKDFFGNIINIVRGENELCDSFSERFSACLRHRIWHIIESKASSSHHNQPSPPLSENTKMSIPLTSPRDHQSKNKPVCSIRLPAARNIQLHLPRGVTPHPGSALGTTIFEGLSTDEAISQFGVRLPSQSLAVTLIAEGIDSWGRDIVASAPAPLVHLMATGWKSDDSGNSNIKIPSSELFLPPATAILLVGPEGVGKLHLSRSVARLLLGHCTAFDQNEVLSCQCYREDYPTCSQSGGNICTETTLQSNATVGFPVDGVLEILAEDYAHFSDNDIRDHRSEIEGSSQLRRRIVEHIRYRESLGSVIIIQHVEHFPVSLLSDIFRVLSGKSYTLSYNASGGAVEASCNGTLFLFTSKQWGTRSIFREIQRNGGMARLHREQLISSIRREVISHTNLQMSKVSKWRMLFLIHRF